MPIHLPSYVFWGWFMFWSVLIITLFLGLAAKHFWSAALFQFWREQGKQPTITFSKNIFYFEWSHPDRRFWKNRAHVLTCIDRLAWQRQTCGLTQCSDADACFCIKPGLNVRSDIIYHKGWQMCLTSLLACLLAFFLPWSLPCAVTHGPTLVLVSALTCIPTFVLPSNKMSISGMYPGSLSGINSGILSGLHSATRSDKISGSFYLP